MDDFWSAPLLMLVLGLTWAAADTAWALRRERIDRERRRDMPAPAPRSAPAADDRRHAAGAAPREPWRQAAEIPAAPLPAAARVGAGIAAPSEVARSPVAPDRVRAGSEPARRGAVAAPRPGAARGDDASLAAPASGRDRGDERRPSRTSDLAA